MVKKRSPCVKFNSKERLENNNGTGTKFEKWNVTKNDKMLKILEYNTLKFDNAKFKAKFGDIHSKLKSIDEPFKH